MSSVLHIDTVKHRVANYLEPIEGYYLSVCCKDLATVRWSPNIRYTSNVLVTQMWMLDHCCVCNEVCMNGVWTFGIYTHDAICRPRLTYNQTYYLNPYNGDLDTYESGRSNLHKAIITVIEPTYTFLVNPKYKYYHRSKNYYVTLPERTIFATIRTQMRTKYILQILCSRIDGPVVMFKQRARKKLSFFKLVLKAIDPAPSMSTEDTIRLLWDKYKKSVHFCSVAELWCASIVATACSYFPKTTWDNLAQRRGGHSELDMRILRDFCENFDHFKHYLEHTELVELRRLIQRKALKSLCDRLEDHTIYGSFSLSDGLDCPDEVKIIPRSEVNWDTFKPSPRVQKVFDLRKTRWTTDRDTVETVHFHFALDNNLNIIQRV